MRGLLPLLVLLCLLAAPAQPTDAAPTSRGWDYVVRVDEKLERMHVRLCFRQFHPKRLVLQGSEALSAFSFPMSRPGTATLRKRPDGGSVEPLGLGASGCVEYEVDLRVLGRVRGSRLVSRVGRDLIVDPGALLLRPALWPADARVTIRVGMPAGMRAAVPWTPTLDGRGYLLDRHALQLRGRIALGRFPTDELRIAGTIVDIAMLDAPHRATPEGVRAWIAGAVGAVAELYGRFPTPRLLAIVQPTPSRGEPVVFGMAMRAGGGHVHLILSALAKDAELPGEWVAVHELTHLGMPWTYDQEAWIQEGFVTYYQEVLRARAGFLTEQEAWQRIHDGFNRGRRRGGDRVLQLESRDMGREHNYHRVYWAGAAIALRTDVELRRASGGRQSLDDVMRLMHRRYGGTRGPHEGVQLLRFADRALGVSTCGAIAEGCLARPAFPEVAPVFRALGIRIQNGRVVLDDSAPMAAERQRIMRPRAK